MPKEKDKESEETAIEEAEKASEEQTTEAEPEKVTEEVPTESPAADEQPEEAPSPDPEKEKLLRELTIARAQLAAVQSDIDPKQAADAVILAVYALEQEGKTPDEKSISNALKSVMERHPEWKASKAPEAPEKGGAEEPKEKAPEHKTAPGATTIF